MKAWWRLFSAKPIAPREPGPTDPPPTFAVGDPVRLRTRPERVRASSRSSGRRRAKGEANDEGRTYIQTLWKAPKAQLRLNALGVGPEGRANVTVT